MKNFIGAGAMLLFFVQISLAQNISICGNSVEDQLQFRPRLRENKLAVENNNMVQDRDAIQYVPIHYHIVGDASGNGKIKEAGILDQLCDLNEAYVPMNIRFYLSPHPTYGLFDRSINNDNVYTNQNNSFLMNTRRHTHALNVFVVETPSTGSSNPGIVLAYYNPSNDWIVERKTQTKGGHNGTLPHEVGHFFSLMHTFFGYEPNPFSSDDAGWPIAPVTSPGGQPTERVNGTNCSTAGDEICDTPPDYNFGLDQGTCNTYTGGAKDPLGDPVDPMEINFMSYFPDCGTNYVFTQDQQDIIVQDLAKSSRNYLDNTFVPLSTDITTPDNLLVSPAPASTTAYFDQVLLQWKSVAGAKYYLLEVDLSSNFNTPILQSFVLTDTSKIVTGLTANKLYQWRVRPFNEYVTCANAKQRSFRTSAVSATSDGLEGIDAWQLSPNPVEKGQPVLMAVQSSKQMEAQIQLMDASGRLVYQQNSVSIAQGANNMQLPTAGLSSGIYFVRMMNENGQDIRRLSVQ